MRVDLRHPSGGAVKLVGSPIKMSATPPRYDRPPPLLGQHTGEVLREMLGMGDEELQALQSKGVI
jgi:formyl-CoA transferase